MKNLIYGEFREILKKREGVSRKPYFCSKNKLTIGYGWNLTDNGLPDKFVSKWGYNCAFKYITTEQIEWLLTYAIENLVVIKLVNIFGMELLIKLNDYKLYCIADMIYNMGAVRFSKFKQMIEAIEIADYKRAVIEIENSDYYRYFEKINNPRAKENRDWMNS